jgi:hypothetical protein
MRNDSDHQQYAHREPELAQHDCGNLFGCGEENGTGVLSEDIKDEVFTKRVADRLLHMDVMNQEQLDGCLTARGRSRRRMMQASSFMGALAGIGPWFHKLGFNKLADAANAHQSESGGDPQKKKDDEGRVHVVESNEKTVRLGVTTPRSSRSSRSIPAIPSAFLTRGRTS